MNICGKTFTVAFCRLILPIDKATICRKKICDCVKNRENCESFPLWTFCCILRAKINPLFMYSYYCLPGDPVLQSEPIHKGIHELVRVHNSCHGL